MNSVDWLGTLAGAVTCLTFLPQVIKTWKMRSARDVSLLMFVIAALNEVMWIAYGALLAPVNWVLILTNAIMLPMSLIIIFLKLRFSR